MDTVEARKTQAASQIMFHMCKVAIIAASGSSGRGEEAVKWWQSKGANGGGWNEQRSYLALAVAYAAGHVSKQAIEDWKP